MATNERMSKVPEWPRPHDRQVNFDMSAESATSFENQTIIPIITYDEGLGVINAYESCPQNASFVEASTDHCYPTSRVNKIFMQLEATLTKGAIETDKIHALKFGTMLIHTAFNETGLASDEVSTLDLNEILELDLETTDRQMYPLWNDTDLLDGKTNAMLDLPAETPGLDTDLEIEGISFQSAKYYDCLQYYTTSEKLKAVSTGIQWHYLTKTHPTMKLRFHQQSNTKFMNPYTFLGLMVLCPQNAGFDQLGDASETTAGLGHINFTSTYRYLEWNHEFNHALQ